MLVLFILVGTNNRMTRSTDFNATSSRSHALLQLTFEIESHLESGQVLLNRSKLNLVDLAGSEKIPFTSDPLTSKHLKELTMINKSLSCLGNVISALASTVRTHIPYRDSKLTRILQDSLGGNTRTILVACVAPTVLHVTESLSTLQFADRARHVMLSVKANTVVDDKQTLIRAQTEIARLKGLLAQALKQLQSVNPGIKSSEDIAAMSDFTSSGRKGLDQLMQENETLKQENRSLQSMLHHQGSNNSSYSGSESMRTPVRGRSSTRSNVTPNKRTNIRRSNPSKAMGGHGHGHGHGHGNGGGWNSGKYIV